MMEEELRDALDESGAAGWLQSVVVGPVLVGDLLEACSRDQIAWVMLLLVASLIVFACNILLFS